MAAAWVSRLRKPVFGRYLFITNTLGCATLMGLGDIAVQKMEQSVSKRRLNVGETDDRNTYGTRTSKVTLDWHRVGRMFSMGLVLGPFNHGWYTLLDKVLPGKTGMIVAKKIIADQVVASPFFAFTFFMGSGTLEGQTLAGSFDEFKAKFWHVYMIDWTVWPAAQAVNFLFVPTYYRVMYVALITLGWNTFLSYTKHRDQIKRFNQQDYTLHHLTDCDTKAVNDIS